MMNGFSLICLLAIIDLSEALGCGTEPCNAAVITGSRISFPCSRHTSNSEHKSLWKFYSIEEPQRAVDVFNGHHIVVDQSYQTRERFSMNTSSLDQYDLIMNIVTMEDAGTYQCVKSMDDQYSAELTVIESAPECHVERNVTNDTVMVEDELELWCRVQYRGNWPPSMTWKTSGDKDLTPKVNTTVTTNSSIQTLTTSLILLADSIENGIRVSCVTSFKQGTFPNMLKRNGTRMAPNIPEYNNVWTSPTITVLNRKVDNTTTDIFIILSIAGSVGFVVLLQFFIIVLVMKRRRRARIKKEEKRGRTNAPIIHINMDMGLTLSRTFGTRYFSPSGRDEHVYQNQNCGNALFKPDIDYD